MLKLIGKPVRGIGRSVRWWFRSIARLLITVSGVLFVALMGGVFTLTNHAEHVACTRLHQQTSRPTQYVRGGWDVLWSGECYIKLGPKKTDWVPVTRWRPGN